MKPARGEHTSREQPAPQGRHEEKTMQAEARKNRYAGECCRCGCHVKSERGSLVQKVSQAYFDSVRYDTHFDQSAHFEEAPVWLIVCNACSEKTSASASAPAVEDQAMKHADIAIVYEQKPVAENFHCFGCGCQASRGFCVQTKSGAKGRRCEKCCGK